MSSEEEGTARQVGGNRRGKILLDLDSLPVSFPPSRPLQRPSRTSSALLRSWYIRPMQSAAWFTNHDGWLGVHARTHVETWCALSPPCFLLGEGYLQQGFLL